MVNFVNSILETAIDEMPLTKKEYVDLKKTRLNFINQISDQRSNLIHLISENGFILKAFNHFFYSFEQPFLKHLI